MPLRNDSSVFARFARAHKVVLGIGEVIKHSGIPLRPFPGHGGVRINGQREQRLLLEFSERRGMAALAR